MKTNQVYENYQDSKKEKRVRSILLRKKDPMEPLYKLPKRGFTKPLHKRAIERLKRRG